MKIMTTRGLIRRLGAAGAVAVAMVLAVRLPAQTADEQAIRQVIVTYAHSIDTADTAIAEQVWSNAPEVSFIHPLGEDHGRHEIEADIYRNLMGSMFSKRKLSPRDIKVQVYGDTAWSEFQWNFVATLRKDASPFESQGRETQVYHKENGQWRIVHVHYSGLPVTSKLKGF